MTMRQWEEKLDAFLAFNGRNVLTHAGKISHDVTEQLAHKRYNDFDTMRSSCKRREADQEDISYLEKITSTSGRESDE